MTIAPHLLLVSVNDMLIRRDHGWFNTTGGAESIQCGFQLLQIILMWFYHLYCHLHRP